MNTKFIAMVILNPDIQAEQMDFIQSGITTLFEQHSKVQKIWFLGKQKLDYKIKKHTEGYYLKLEVLGKDKKIEDVKRLLKNNKYVIFSLVIKDENRKNNLPFIKKTTLPFTKSTQFNSVSSNLQSKKIYMLISKNLKLPFAESSILAISDSKEKVFEIANKKLQEYIYVKGYRALYAMKTIKDLEKELKRSWKVQFVFNNNPNVGQELLIQEKNLI